MAGGFREEIQYGYIRKLSSVGGGGVLVKSWKDDREVQCEWGHQKPRHMESRGGLVLFSTRKYDPHKFLYGLKERVASAGALPRKRRDENVNE